MSERSDRPGGAPDSGRTADSAEGWLRSLGQRGPGHDAEDRPRRTPSSAARRGTAGEEEVAAFLRAVRRLQASPQAQSLLADRMRQLALDPRAHPTMRAIVAALMASDDPRAERPGGSGSSGATGILERPEVSEHLDPKLSDGGDGGGGDDDEDDDDDGDDDDGDDEPWPTAFVGYRTGVVERVDVGNCSDGCCTALFVDHPGVRAAVWFPTEASATLASKVTELLARSRGDTADLSVQPFGEGAAPGRGQLQAAIQFFTDDIHLDEVEHEADRAQGAVARFRAYDQGLGHGGPALVDILLDAPQARAFRKGLRRSARQAPRDRSDRHDHF